MKIKKIAIILFTVIISVSAALVIAGAGTEKKAPRIAYITFDDGPTLNTPNIVETLNKYGAKATFFVLEERIIMYPDYIKQILAGGNAIGLHGVSHSEAIYSSPKSPLDEMNQANKALEKLTGHKSRLVRVPYGSDYRLTKEQAHYLAESGYLLWDWNVDPRDSVGKIVPERVLENMRRDLARCDNPPVILFHDRKSTANLLGEALRYLKDEGYEMRPLSEKQHAISRIESE